MTKSIEQQIADMQNKLNALRTKKASADKREDTRRKIILGAEIAKLIGSDVKEISDNEELRVLLIGHVSLFRKYLNNDDYKNHALKLGRDILSQWKEEKK